MHSEYAFLTEKPIPGMPHSKGSESHMFGNSISLFRLKLQISNILNSTVLQFVLILKLKLVHDLIKFS